MKCTGCGTDKAIRTTKVGNHPETCDRCDGRSLDTGVIVDAAGQPISFPDGGFYSVAAGDRFWSNKRDYANYLNKNGFVQRPDLAMGRKNHNGLKNAPRR